MGIIGTNTEDMFRDYSDEKLVELAADGDNGALECIMERYKNIIRIKTRSYYLVGADSEDVVQEGMIGLFKAVRDYRPDKFASFKTFAELCITRQILTAVKLSNRKKHIPLNSYISLDKQTFDEDSDQTLMDTLSSEVMTNPEDIIISNESVDYIQSKIGKVLSPFEFEVINSYLDGSTYVEMAEQLGKTPKSIDNALQRIKRKLEKYLNGENPLK